MWTRRFVRLTLGLAAVLLLADVSRSLQPEVEVEEGLLKGKYMSSEYQKRAFAAFMGIPYAVPPVGPMRFKEAEPARPWLGILNATSFGSSCLQYSHFTQDTPFEVYGSEDCLYLNVYTPNLSSSGSDLLDVIFYIHGGAFMFLAGHPFGPEYLMDRQIVLVTFNYRLGPLGFLSTEDSIVPGNNGLKDQLLALKWVRRNINKFGGNPNRISLAGTSAGGASVHYHVLSPQAKGLFTHGIIMSGAVLNPWPLTENSLEKAKRLSGELGCPVEKNAEMVECLRTRPAEQIVSKSKLFIPWLYSPFTPFGPVVEPPNPNAFIDKQPIDIILSGEASDIPLLFSYTSDEGLYPGGRKYRNFISRKDCTKADKLVSSLKTECKVRNEKILVVPVVECYNIVILKDVVKSRGWKIVALEEDTLIIHNDSLQLFPEIIQDEKLLAALDSRWNELLPHLLDYNFTILNDRQKKVADEIKTFYLGNKEARNARDKIIQMIGDRLFIVGIRESAKLHAQLYQSPSYAYVFDFKGPQRGFMAVDIYDGASHGDDLAYIFKKEIPWGPIGTDKESVEVSRYMIDMWMNFINDSTKTPGWAELKKALPHFGYLEVKSGGESNSFKIDKNSDVEDFWSNLGFQENVEERIRHSEL